MQTVRAAGFMVLAFGLTPSQVTLASPPKKGIVFSAKAQRSWDLFVVPLSGGSKPVRVTSTPQDDQEPAVSPDGKRIAFSRGSMMEQRGEIFIAQIDGTRSEQITNLGSYCSGAAWSPDGKKLAFHCLTRTTFNLHTVDLATRKVTRLTNAWFVTMTYPAWSPDGRNIAFHAWDRTKEGENWDLYVVPASGSKSPRQLTSAPGFEWLPSWSPDGRSLAFWSFDGAVWQLRLLELETGNWKPVGDLSQYVANYISRAVWVDDGWVVATFERGSLNLRHVDRTGERLRPLVVDPSVDATDPAGIALLD